MTMKTILKEFYITAIIIENYITIKVMNLFDLRLEIYITVLNRNSFNKMLLINLNNLVKSLKKEEICMIEKLFQNKI